MTDDSGSFRESATASVEDYLRVRPESATDLGDHRFDDRLDDRSADGRLEASNVLRRHRDVVSAIDPESLPIAERVDREILLGALDMSIFSAEELGEITWNPLAYNPGDGIFPLVARETRPLPERLEAIAARLNQIPRVVELAERQLENPPRVHLETALAQNPGVIRLVGQEVSGLFVGADRGLVGEAESAQARAVQALTEHGRFLSDALERLDSSGDPGGDFRIGPRLFARKLELSLNSNIRASEVLRRAESHLDVVTDQIEEACIRYLESESEATGLTGPDAIRAALDLVARDHPDNDSVVGLATVALDEATRAVFESGIVSVPEDPMAVQVMPEFRRGVAVAYCDPPGPLESGGETFLAVAPTPDSWSLEQAESFYREYNSAMVSNLIVHEAMPGHALQLAVARRFEGSTPIRKVFWSGSFVEGWAVHAERIMAQAGHGGLAVRISQLKMQLRMTINAILDASIHAGDMDEQEALELMMKRGFQEFGEASGKWRRACLTSAQLSTYFVGYIELADLFDRIGSVPNYDFALAHGSPPPRLLETLVA